VSLVETFAGHITTVPTSNDLDAHVMIYLSIQRKLDDGISDTVGLGITETLIYLSLVSSSNLARITVFTSSLEAWTPTTRPSPLTTGTMNCQQEASW
jgi:hypothetical protein